MPKSRFAGPPRRRSIAGAVMLGLLSLCCGHALSAELHAVEVLAKVQAWLDGTHTLAGQFEQTLISSALGAGLAESGQLYIERPGKMRWDYISPERKVAIIKGDKTWFYLAEDEQIFLGRLDDELELLPTLLANQTDLSELFGVSLTATPRRGGDGAYLLQLEPLSPSTGVVEQVILNVSAPDFAINSAEILDAGGNTSSYRFSSVERNEGLPEAIFQFEPPPGTLISGNH